MEGARDADEIGPVRARVGSQCRGNQFSSALTRAPLIERFITRRMDGAAFIREDGRR
jgi:hypothetical protein